MTEPKIICPTHGRAGNVKIFRLLPDITLCVAESQLPLYQEHYPDADYLVHPDTVQGMAMKRQWMWERHPNLFMLDDDIVSMRDMTVGPGQDASITNPQHVRDLVARLFDQAEQMGAYLVGFNNFAHPAAYRPQLPFGLTGAIAGRALGLRAGSRLEFPPNRMMITDDLYISALNAYFNRFLLRDDRYVFYAPGCWDNTGGMATYRTWDRMVENNALLRDLFGEAIQKKTGTALAGNSHEAQLKLKVPW
jgi:hypothetical protein